MLLLWQPLVVPRGLTSGVNLIRLLILQEPNKTTHNNVLSKLIISGNNNFNRNNFKKLLCIMKRNCVSN